MTLPSLDALCPYCAAHPALPCSDAIQQYLHGYVHATDPEWSDLFALVLLTEGLIDYARSLDR